MAWFTLYAYLLIMNLKKFILFLFHPDTAFNVDLLIINDKGQLKWLISQSQDKMDVKCGLKQTKTEITFVHSDKASLRLDIGLYTLFRMF
jgi:hypothetical protein